MHQTRLAGAIAALLLAAHAPGARALAFDSVVVFGDSLSDSGAFAGRPDAGAGSRFTTDPGPVWAEVLAGRFGLPARANNPANPTGTDPQGSDYAQGGARVTDTPGVGSTASPQGATPVAGQVAQALADGRGGNPNALYLMWAGANDVFFQLDRLAGGAAQADVSNALVQAAGAQAGLVAQLAAGGARYIVVPNLPDIGDTPSSVLLAVSAAGAGNPRLGNALAAAVAARAQPAGTPAQQEAVRQAALGAAAAQLGVPVAVLQGAMAQVQGASSALAAGYNQALGVLLARTGANVIPLDVHSLLKEAMADPAALGLVNVTGTACVTSSSLPCTGATLIAPGADQAFLFADGVHPTSAGHRLIADYAGAVIEAPALVSALAEAPLATTRTQARALEGQARAARDTIQPGRWGLIAGLGAADLDADATRATLGYDGDGRDLLIGAGYRASDGLLAGLALGVSDADLDFPGDRGGFDLRAYSLSAFADWQSGPWQGQAQVGLTPRIELDSITRHVHLGGATRLERGSTRGDALSARAALGLDLLGAEGLQAGPRLGLSYARVQVDGYREAGGLSTSMGFDSQHRDSLLLEAGLFADYRTQTAAGPLRLHAALGREEELKDDGRAVTAYLETMPEQRFSLYDVETESGAWTVDLGVSAQVGGGVSVGLGYAWRSGDRLGESSSLGLGVQVPF